MIKDKFFGRVNYLEILEKRIRGLKDGYRQNLAIIGDELVGKTSIVSNFLNKFYDNRIITLYLEVRPESAQSFTRRFIAVLLYNFLVASDIPLKEDLNFLIDKSSKYIPRTIEKIKLALSASEKRKKYPLFSELLSLTDSIYQETGKFSVVIFDEFHNLESIDIKNLYAEWSKLLILQKNTMYVIISSMKFKAKAILSKDLSLLFGNFHLITVEPFDIKASEQYLKQRLHNLNLNSGLLDFIVNFTGGHPFYLEVISEALLKLNFDNLTGVLEDLLFNPSGILNQKFSNYLKRFLDAPFSQDYISILHLISSGRNKLKDIAHILHRPKKELAVRINRLLELDTVTRSGDFLKINDRVFSFWLKFVYQEKLNSLTFDAKNQKELFKNNIDNMIQEFLLSAKRPMPERITELLRLFEDETMQLERKKIKLTHFREIKTLEFNNENMKEGLIARSNDSLWIVAFKHDLLTENDISEFVKECRKFHFKLQKKIIIALQDIDTNARLRAFEEKILTWDLNNLNQILDLFYKPRVIL
jgi:hypothetical protein